MSFKYFIMHYVSEEGSTDCDSFTMFLPRMPETGSDVLNMSNLGTTSCRDGHQSILYLIKQVKITKLTKVIVASAAIS